MSWSKPSTPNHTSLLGAALAAMAAGFTHIVRPDSLFGAIPGLPHDGRLDRPPAPEKYPGQRKAHLVGAWRGDGIAADNRAESRVMRSRAIRQAHADEQRNRNKHRQNIVERDAQRRKEYRRQFNEATEADMKKMRQQWHEQRLEREEAKRQLRIAATRIGGGL